MWFEIQIPLHNISSAHSFHSNHHDRKTADGWHLAVFEGGTQSVLLWDNHSLIQYV